MFEQNFYHFIQNFDLRKIDKGYKIIVYVIQSCSTFKGGKYVSQKKGYKSVK